MPGAGNSCAKENGLPVDYKKEEFYRLVVQMKWAMKHFYSPYVPWRLLGALILCALVFILYYLLKVASFPNHAAPGSLVYLTSLLSFLYAFILGLICLMESRKRRSGTGTVAMGQEVQYISPQLVGAGLLFFSVGQLVMFFSMLVTHRIPDFPSFQHYIQIGMYLCFVGAILLLPARNLSPFLRLRTLLDSLMIMVALVTLCFYFFLAPLLVNGNGTSIAKIMSGFFLAADLVLVFCLLFVALRSGEPTLRPVLFLFSLAILILFAVHIGHAYEMLYSGYNWFSASNAGLMMAAALIVGAAQTTKTILRQNATAERPLARTYGQYGKVDMLLLSRTWRTLLPLMLVLFFSSLLLSSIWIRGGKEAFPGQMFIVYASGLALLILLVLRQFLTLYQVGILQRQLQVKNSSLSMLNAQLEKQAMVDPLTGLPNHRTLVERLDEALKQIRASGGSCSVIFMDVDHFKAINDCYGHQVGDTVLSNFARLVKSGLRPGDWVGRWGGEEFVAILPETDSLEALNIAEGLRKRIERHVLAGNGEIHVTCSSGVATYPQDASERESLIMGADKAMYAAKHLGRNQTRAAHEPLVLAMDPVGPEYNVSDEEEKLMVVDTLLALLDSRDPSTSQHMRRVGTLALKLALELGLSEKEAHIVSMGGLLHDVGKVAIPDDILLKRDQLSREEFERVFQHPIIGARILAPVLTLRGAATIVRSHHERMDGSGYPDGLQGEDIPLGARIVAVVDAYDAMIADRVYRPGRAPAEALEELRRRAGSQFDPGIVEALARLLSVTPSLSSPDAA